MRTRFCSVLLLAAFLFFLPAASVEQLSPFVIDQLVGKQAPDFTLTDQNGKSVTLSTFHGKPLLLNFWGPWAPNSLDEVRTLVRLRERADMKELVVIGITADKKTDAAQAFLRRKPVNYPILTDPDLSVTTHRYAAFMIPLSLLIDRHGIVTKIYFGQQEWLRPKMLQAIVEHVK
ncbi:MAG TPA: TlpA disulfide reductase family protein [Dissulfurispiraceae bacterium]|nr:TlpA disulfide reductase family protein [Dissulfurispiraceae bacterium]